MNEIPQESLGLSPKPPETILPASEEELVATLHEALVAGDRATIEGLVGHHPRDLFCWATLAASTGDGIDGYAFARVGYHRGLDTMRASGWRGSGYIRAHVPSNRGFLTCLALLHRQASYIGEKDEQDRCLEFLYQLDPAYDWNSFPFENPIDFLFPS